LVAAVVTLYRIIRGQQFALEDVQSKLERCVPRTGSELLRVELWSGLSMFVTAPQASRAARKHNLGRMLVRLDIPGGDPMVVLTSPNHNGHVTVWACAQHLASFHAGVIPVT
jgi:hypothetical protein